MIAWTLATWLFYLLIFGRLDTFIQFAEKSAQQQNNIASNQQPSNSIAQGSPLATLQFTGALA